MYFSAKALKDDANQRITRPAPPPPKAGPSVEDIAGFEVQRPETHADQQREKTKAESRQGGEE